MIIKKLQFYSYKYFKLRSIRITRYARSLTPKINNTWNSIFIKFLKILID